MIVHDRLPDGGIEIIQHTMRPCVYLDHWAWRMLGENVEFGDRLIKAIINHSGTVALSWLNVLEFLSVEEDQQRLSSALVENLFPRIVFIKLDPFEINSQDKDPQNKEDPHLDTEYSRALINAGSSDAKPLSVNRIFSNESKEMEDRKRGLSEVIVQRIEKMREEIDYNKDFKANLRRDFKLEPSKSWTIHILREYLRTLIIDKRKNFSENDAVDMLHTVVPLAYCDYALLDRGGIDHCSRIKQRLKKEKNEMPIAQVFNKRKIEDFFLCLEKPNCRTVYPKTYAPIIPGNLRRVISKR